MVKRVRKKTDFVNVGYHSNYHDPKLPEALKKIKKRWHYPGQQGLYRGTFEKIDWKQRVNTYLIDVAECKLGHKVGNMTALYLDGPDTCSTKCFMGLGLQPGNLFAVSSQPGVETAVKQINPEIGFSSDKIENFAKYHKYAYDVIYLDLCSQWKKGKKITKRVFELTDYNSIFAVSVCRRGRGNAEKDVKADIMRMYRKHPQKDRFKMRHMKTIMTASNYMVLCFHLKKIY